MKITSQESSKSIIAVAVLAAIAILVVGVGSASDKVGRSAGPELPLIEYVEAIGREDIEDALEQLAPELREQAASFVAWELGNRYTILESVVRTSSLVDGLLGRAHEQPKLVVVMEIETKGQGLWRATEELPVKQIGGRWYLLKAPLSP